MYKGEYMSQKNFEYIKHYLKLYGLQLGILTFVVIMTGSVITFHPQDQSFFYHARYATCYNLFGYVGATLAAALIYLFGSAAYLFLGLCLYLMSFTVRSKSIEQEIDRIVGSTLFVAVMSMLCNMYQIGYYEFSSFGGLLGQFLINKLSYFDVGAKLFIVYSLLFVSSTLVLRFAHLKIAYWVVKLMTAIIAYTIQLDHMPARCIRSFATQIAQLCYFVQKIVRYCIDLLNGSLIQQSAQSIVAFERDEDQPSRDMDRLMQDMFGQQQENFVDTTASENQIQKQYAEKFENKPHFQTDHHTENMISAVAEVDNQNAPLQNPIKKYYELPDVDTMLSQGNQIIDDETDINKAVLQEQSAILEEKLAQFGIKGKVVRVHPGPVITMFEYQPESHIKLSKILALEDDLAMALQAISIRILAPIPGKPVVGFEVANKVRKPVLLSKIFHSKAWTNFEGHLPLILGEDTHGEQVVVDLATMPHVLIAGSTGSGKSVAVNCMLVSLLCAKSPDQLRLIIIDPKQLEFSSYEDIAHLLFPIVTDSKKAVPVLRWLVTTMEERYEMMAEHGVKNIFEYQKLAETSSELPDMPFIVLIIDELADLMMTTGKDVEDLIARIAQMSRAAGIHMIVATQRPSVDVITGLIKVNFPNRISFKVTSKVDSRTILDVVGAERLLGKGDMLFLDAKDPEMKRAHGAYVSNKEINFLVNHIKHQQDVAYLDLSELLTSEASNDALLEADQELYKMVVDEIKELDEISISMIQRKFRIGYNRSARLVEALEAEGHILPSDGGKMRRVIKD